MKDLFLMLMTAMFIISGCDFSNSTAPDLIIYNADIYAADVENSTYEAIAITDHKISKLGPSEDLLKSQSDETELIDAKGAFIIPGLIEGHGHFSGLGNSLMHLNFLKSKSWEEIVAMVEERAQTTPKGEWIIGRGWHQEKWDHAPHNHIHGYPRHIDLSEAVPDHPVLLRHASGHGLLANKKAMDIAGVNLETPNPAGGEIVRDENGKAIGVFEERAMAIIRNAYEYYKEQQDDEEKIAEWYRGIELAQQECLENGITSFQDAGARMEELERYQQMAEEGKLKIRLWSMIRHSSEDMKGKLEDYKMIGIGNNHFTCNAIKTEVDGALGSFGAWLLEPYNDKPKFVGQNTTTIEEVEAIAKLASANKMQLCVHAIGDRANREVLDLMEPYAHKDNNLRWRIEHSQHIHPKDIPRFADLNIIASMQGIHCTSDAPYVEKRLGHERSKNGAYNWRALIDAGAVVTNGTDAPVEDIDPIESFYASVTRKRIDSGFEFFPENAMTRDEAIKSYTATNAYAAFEDDIKGTIKIGKLADLTILNKNWRTCTDQEILDTEVLYTIVGGEVLFKK